MALLRSLTEDLNKEAPKYWQASLLLNSNNLLNLVVSVPGPTYIQGPEDIKKLGEWLISVADKFNNRNTDA